MRISSAVEASHITLLVSIVGSDGGKETKREDYDGRDMQIIEIIHDRLFDKNVHLSVFFLDS